VNKKTITKVLKRKINSWLTTIKDEKVRKLAEKNTIVTGGAIANLLLGEQVKDYDVYFRDKETTLAVAEYYVKEFNERHVSRKNKLGGNAKAYVLDGERDLIRLDSIVGLHPSSSMYAEFANQGKVLTRMIAGCTPDRVKIIVRSDGVAAENEEVLDAPFEDAVDALNQLDATSDDNIEQLTPPEKPEDRYRPVFLSTNAITLSDKVQLVVRFYGEPDQIHENYDFVHCTNYYDHKEGVTTLRPAAVESLINKELKYVGSKYPLCSVIRTRKFIKRGFYISAGQYLKMCFQLSQLDLTNIDVLEDQLVGVDSAYFMSVISALRTKADSDSEWSVDNSYLATIIDRIF
jgi:hypothetical protein